MRADGLASFMESLFYRYRNIIVLLLVMCAQIVLLAWQVKSDNDVPLGGEELPLHLVELPAGCPGR